MAVSALFDPEVFQADLAPQPLRPEQVASPSYIDTTFSSSTSGQTISCLPQTELPYGKTVRM